MENAEMKVEEISMEDFRAEEAKSGRGRRGGINLELMQRALSTPLRVAFEDPAKANSKLTALYAVRRRLKAQVKILKRDSFIYLAPGKYTATTRQRRKSGA
jgi:hypothetical protein